MARMSDISITFQVEPIIKLDCLNSQCRFNLLNEHIGSFCNLKRIVLDEKGGCIQFEEKEK
jgi:hypothetical protein